MDLKTEVNRGWQLIRQGDPVPAITIYEQAVVQRPCLGFYNNFGTALMEAGLFERAEAAYRTVRTLPNPIGYCSIKVGAAIWCQGRYNDACEDWLTELNRIMTSKIKNNDSSGLFIVCMLWWASQRLDKPEMWSKLQPMVKKVIKTRGQQYPFGLAIHSFIAGSSDRDQLLNYTVKGVYKPEAEYDAWNYRQLCQAWFYLAGKEEPGSVGWTNCIETALRYGKSDGLGTAEYDVVKHELRKYPVSAD